MSTKWGIRRYFLVSVGSIVLASIALSICYFVYFFFFGLAIQTVKSPKRNHVAVLRTHFGIIDYDLSVTVDGVSRFRRSDIHGISPTQLRAVLVWDRTGRILVYEQLGKIEFAYDVVENRQIGLDEVEKYCLSPMSAEYEQMHKAVCNEN